MVLCRQVVSTTVSTSNNLVAYTYPQHYILAYLAATSAWYVGWVDMTGEADLQVDKLNALNAASTNVHTQACTAESNDRVFCRSANANTYLCAVTQDNSAGTGSKLVYSYSTNGVNFTDGNIAAPGAAADDRIFIDFIFANAKYWLIYAEYIPLAATHKIWAKEIITGGAGSVSLTIHDYTFVWRGTMTAANTYNFCAEVTDGVFNKITFDGTTFTTGAAITITAGTTTEFNFIYYEYGDLKFLTTLGRLYVYDAISTTWKIAVETESVGKMTCVWNTDNTIAYLLFYGRLLLPYKHELIEIATNGLLTTDTVVQTAYFPYYITYALATGFTAYEISDTALTTVVSMNCTDWLFHLPTLTLRHTPALTVSSREALVLSREVPSPTTDFDAALTGWTDSDSANCETTYQATKTLDFVISHVAQLFDNSATGEADIYKYHVTNPFVYSFWFATSDVTKTSYIVFYEGNSVDVGNRRGYLSIGASKIRFFDETATTTLLDPAVNNTWYHLVLQFDASTEKVKIWLDGIYINEFTITDAFTTINTLRFITENAHTAYYAYFACPYAGNSLAEAMQSYWAYHDPRPLGIWYVTGSTFSGGLYTTTCQLITTKDLVRGVNSTQTAITSDEMVVALCDAYGEVLDYSATSIDTTPATDRTITFAKTLGWAFYICAIIENYCCHVGLDGVLYYDDGTTEMPQEARFGVNALLKCVQIPKLNRPRQIKIDGAYSGSAPLTKTEDCAPTGTDLSYLFNELTVQTDVDDMAAAWKTQLDVDAVWYEVTLMTSQVFRPGTRIRFSWTSTNLTVAEAWFYILKVEHNFRSMHQRLLLCTHLIYPEIASDFQDTAQWVDQIEKQIDGLA